MRDITTTNHVISTISISKEEKILEKKYSHGRRCIRRARIEDSGEKRTRETSAREEDCGFVEEIDFFARRARGRGK